MGSDRAAWALVLAGVLAQMIYPALDGDALRAVTVLAVLLLSAGAVAQARSWFGPRAAGLLLLVGAGIGLAAETVGVHTGIPFGSYRYTGTLGPSLAEVPLLVPLAWVMLGFPCLLLGRRLARRVTGPTRHRLVVALVGGWTLAGWDLFLDPQMVDAGHWVWSFPEPALPGVPGIPLTNYLGWVVVSVVLIGALDRVLPRRPAEAAGPADPDLRPTRLDPATVVLAWTWLGSALGNLVLFDRPAVAGWGLLGMGVGVLPYLVTTARDLSRRRPDRAAGPSRAEQPAPAGPPR